MSDEWRELKQLLLTAPDGQLDKSVFPLIEEWSDPPTSLEILEVLDHCVHSALASEFTISVFQVMMDMRLQEEGRLLEDIVPLATWRDQK